MECESCGGYLPASAAACPTCGMTVNDETFEGVLMDHEEQSRALQKLVEERERNIGALSGATSSRAGQSIPTADLRDAPANLSHIWDQLGMTIRPSSPTWTVSTRVADETAEEMRLAMLDFGIDPESSLQDLLDFIEASELGADVWTSPKRKGHRKYRCVLYMLEYGRLRRFVMTEAATAWAAVAAAVIMAFEQGHLEWPE